MEVEKYRSLMHTRYTARLSVYKQIHMQIYSLRNNEEDVCLILPRLVHMPPCGMTPTHCMAGADLGGGGTNQVYAPLTNMDTPPAMNYISAALLVAQAGVMPCTYHL